MSNSQKPHPLIKYSKYWKHIKLINSVNRSLPVIFGCNTVRLWIMDGINGTIYTVLENYQHLKALADKGKVY